MVGISWTLHETVVLLFFTSRKVCQEACSALIHRKCGSTRSLSSIRGRLVSIRCIVQRNGKPPLYDARRKSWIRENVDAWLADQRVPDLSDLISFEQEEREIVRMYQQLNPILHTMSQSTVSTADQTHAEVWTTKTPSNDTGDDWSEPLLEWYADQGMWDPGFGALSDDWSEPPVERYAGQGIWDPGFGAFDLGAEVPDMVFGAFDLGAEVPDMVFGAFDLGAEGTGGFDRNGVGDTETYLI